MFCDLRRRPLAFSEWLFPLVCSHGARRNDEFAHGTVVIRARFFGVGGDLHRSVIEKMEDVALPAAREDTSRTPDTAPRPA
jgi:hypothetical protein